MKKEGAGDVGLQLFMTTRVPLHKKRTFYFPREVFRLRYGATLTDVLAANTLVSNTNISVCNAILT